MFLGMVRRLFRSRLVRILSLILGGLCALVLLALILFLWRLNPMVLQALNEDLPEILGADVVVEDFRLRPFRGHLMISGLTVGQPEGFDPEHPLLTWTDFSARLRVRSLLRGRVVIPEVVLQNATAHLAIDENGLLNVMALKPLAEAPEDKDPPELARSPGPRVQVHSVRLENLHLRLTDASDPKGLVALQLSDLFVGVEGIAVDWIAVEGGYVPSVSVDGVSIRDAVIALQRFSATGEPLEEPTAEEFLEKQAEEDLRTAPADAGPSLPAPPLRLQALSIENIRFSMEDEWLSSDPLHLTVQEIAFALNNLTFDPSRLLDASGQADFSASLVILQPEELPSARFAAGGRLSPVGPGIPEVNAFLRLTGFELVTVEPLLVPGAATALGGRGLDLAVDLALHEELLDARIEILGSQGVLTRLSIGGTPAEPQVDDLMGLLFGVLSRPLVMLQGVGANLLGGGQEIVSGLADASTAVVEGTTRAVGRFARGLTETGRSLVTGDVSGVGSGLQQATIGTVGEIGSTVAEGSGSVLATVSSATTAAGGGDRRENWLASLEERATLALAQANEWLEGRPFPPVRLREFGEIPGSPQEENGEEEG